MLETGHIRARSRPIYLSPLPPNFTDTLNEIKSHEMAVRAGVQFVSEGQSTSSVFLVRSGFGLRSKTLPDGRRQVVSFLFPGDIVGFQSVLIGQMHHSAEARSDMTLSVISHRHLQALWRDKFESMTDTLRAMAYEQVRLMKAMLSIGQYTAEEAIASLLHSLYSRASAHGLIENGAMPFPFRQSDIADALGLSLVHTNKTLAKLRRAGQVDIADGRLKIQDPPALARAYMFDMAEEPYAQMNGSHNPR